MSLLNELKTTSYMNERNTLSLLACQSNEGPCAYSLFVEQQEHTCGTHREDAHIAHTQIFHLRKGEINTVLSKQSSKTEYA